MYVRKAIAQIDTEIKAFSETLLHNQSHFETALKIGFVNFLKAYPDWLDKKQDSLKILLDLASGLSQKKINPYFLFGYSGEALERLFNKLRDLPTQEEKSNFVVDYDKHVIFLSEKNELSDQWVPKAVAQSLARLLDAVDLKILAEKRIEAEQALGEIAVQLVIPEENEEQVEAKDFILTKKEYLEVINIDLLSSLLLEDEPDNQILVEKLCEKYIEVLPHLFGRHRGVYDRTEANFFLIVLPALLVPQSPLRKPEHSHYFDIIFDALVKDLKKQTGLFTQTSVKDIPEIFLKAFDTHDFLNQFQNFLNLIFDYAQPLKPYEFDHVRFFEKQHLKYFLEKLDFSIKEDFSFYREELYLRLLQADSQALGIIFERNPRLILIENRKTLTTVLDFIIFLKKINLDQEWMTEYFLMPLLDCFPKLQNIEYLYFWTHLRRIILLTHAKIPEAGQFLTNYFLPLLIANPQFVNLNQRKLLRTTLINNIDYFYKKNESFQKTFGKNAVFVINTTVAYLAEHQLSLFSLENNLNWDYYFKIFTEISNQKLFNTSFLIRNFFPNALKLGLIKLSWDETQSDSFRIITLLNRIKTSGVNPKTMWNYFIYPAFLRSFKELSVKNLNEYLDWVEKITDFFILLKKRYSISVKVFFNYGFFALLEAQPELNLMDSDDRKLLEQQLQWLASFFSKFKEPHQQTINVFVELIFFDFVKKNSNFLEPHQIKKSHALLNELLTWQEMIESEFKTDWITQYLFEKLIPLTFNLEKEKRAEIFNKTFEALCLAVNSAGIQRFPLHSLFEITEKYPDVPSTYLLGLEYVSLLYGHPNTKNILFESNKILEGTVIKVIEKNFPQLFESPKAPESIKLHQEILDFGSLYYFVIADRILRSDLNLKLNFMILAKMMRDLGQHQITAKKIDVNYFNTIFQILLRGAQDSLDHETKITKLKLFAKQMESPILMFETGFLIKHAVNHVLISGHHFENYDEEALMNFILSLQIAQKKFGKNKVSFTNLCSQLLEKHSYLYFKKNLKELNLFFDLFVQIHLATNRFNQRRVFTMAEATIRQVKKSERLYQLLYLYLLVVQKHSRLAVPLIDGLLDAEVESKLPAAFSKILRDQIFEFIEKLNFFHPELFNEYLRMGDEVVDLLKKATHPILSDQVSPQELGALKKVIPDIYSEKLLADIVQIKIPFSGVSFFDKKFQSNYFSNILEVGDLRNHIPHYWKEKQLTSRISNAGYFLKEGYLATPQEHLGQIIKALSPEDKKTNDQIDTLVENYLSSIQIEKDLLKRNALQHEFVLQFIKNLNSGYELNDLLRANAEPNYEILKKLQEFFTEEHGIKQALKKYFNKVKNARPDLFLRNIENSGMQLRDTAQLIRKINQLIKKVSDAGLREGILSNILKKYHYQDVMTLQNHYRLDMEAARLIRKVLRNWKQSELNINEMTNQLLKYPRDLIIKELQKYEIVYGQNEFEVSFQVVKGVPFGMWGFNAGVCIASDLKLWQKPEFKLLAIIDHQTQALGGFVHIYETEIDGQRIMTVPGIEPSIEFLSTVNAEILYDEIEKALIYFAKIGGYSEVLIPQTPHIFSNRNDFIKIGQKRNYPVRVLSEMIFWDSKYPFNGVYVLKVD